MAMRDLIPWNRPEPVTPVSYREGHHSPFLRMRQEVDRLFDDLFPTPVLGAGWSGSAWPSLEVKESDRELLVTAELPGMTEKDVELSVQEGVLTIRGERRSESEDRDRGWSELYYGRFERRIGLPDGTDEAHCEATFRDGILTVRIPRSAQATRGRRIPINGETRH